MSYSVVIDLPGLPSCNTASHRHWRTLAKENRRWRANVAAEARSQGIPAKPLERAAITCTRFSSREPDFDGLVGSFKSCIDGLNGLVILDDNQSVIGQPNYAWKRVPPRAGRISIEVEGLEREK